MRKENTPLYVTLVVGIILSLIGFIMLAYGISIWESFSVLFSGVALIWISIDVIALRKREYDRP